MSIVEFLSQPLWQRLGLMLVHFLWQGLAIAVLVGVLVRVFRLKHGNTRYAAYLLAFVAMIACPVVTFTAIDIPLSPNTELIAGMQSAEVIGCRWCNKTSATPQGRAGHALGVHRASLEALRTGTAGRHFPGAGK